MRDGDVPHAITDGNFQSSEVDDGETHVDFVLQPAPQEEVARVRSGQRAGQC